MMEENLNEDIYSTINSELEVYDNMQDNSEAEEDNDLQELASSIKDCWNLIKIGFNNIFKVVSKGVFLIIVIAILIITTAWVLPYMLERDTFNFLTIFGG